MKALHIQISMKRSRGLFYSSNLITRKFGFLASCRITILTNAVTPLSIKVPISSIKKTLPCFTKGSEKGFVGRGKKTSTCRYKEGKRKEQCSDTRIASLIPSGVLSERRKLPNRRVERICEGRIRVLHVKAIEFLIFLAGDGQIIQVSTGW